MRCSLANIRSIGVFLCAAACLVAPSVVPAAPVTITWNGGAGNWADSGTWTPVAIPTNGISTYNVRVDGGKTGASVVSVVDISPVIDTINISNTDIVSINNNRELTIAGASIINAGTISFNASGGGSSSLGIQSNATLTGGGVLAMSDDIWNRIYDPSGAGARLTNVNNTIRGAGKIGVGSMSLTNRALIDANMSSGFTLTVAPGFGGSVINSGTMRASNGGVLDLASGVFQNYEGVTSGTIEARADSTVQLQSGAHITGGLLTTNAIGGGAGSVEGVILIPSFSQMAKLEDVTIDGHVSLANDALFYIAGTINNQSSSISLNSIGHYSLMSVDGDTTLTGGGTITMTASEKNYIYDKANTGAVLTNENNTIQGAGKIGANKMALINRGVIDANQIVALEVDPHSTAGVVNKGTLRASGGGQLILTGNGGGTFQNYEGATPGTIEAQHASQVTLAVGAHVIGGQLTTSGSGQINTDAFVPVRLENVTIAGRVVSGVGSTIFLDGATMVTNSPASMVELAGGTYDSAGGTLTNLGKISGFGTMKLRPVNHGTVQAVGGTLTMTDGIQGGSGTVQIDSGASLDLSQGASGSNADNLIHNGTNLNLGGNSFTVGADYINANWGTGNSFNPHANVTSTGGQILAGGNVTQSLSGDVTGGGTAVATMDFGVVHVGESPTMQYRIKNDGTVGPSLRGAIQTGGITDARLIGTGAVAGNFGPVAASGQSGALTVTFNATSAGPLVGQVVHIANNFDNVAEQNLAITGMAYHYADPEIVKLGGVGTLTPTGPNSYTIDLGVVLYGAPNPTVVLKLTNAAPSSDPAYADDLGGNWDIAQATDFILAGFGSFLPIGAGGTVDGLVIELNASLVGEFDGSITLNCFGENASGYHGTLSDVTLNITGTVDVPEPATLSLMVACGAALAARRRRRR